MLMPALSIRQPWAWAICAGCKDVENRSWNTKHRGPFVVHAGGHPALAC
jgi:ASCH domain-containing protein